VKKRKVGLLVALLLVAVPCAFAVVPPNVDIAVTKDGPLDVRPGGTITYTLTVHNNGPNTASDVVLTDPLPAPLTFVSQTQNSGPAFTCVPLTQTTNQTVSCSAATFAAGATAVFTIVTTAPANAQNGDVYNNTASATTTATDTNSGNDSANVGTTVNYLADVSITKTGPDSAQPDTDVVYAIHVANAGPDPAPTLSLTDTFPGTMTFVSIVQTSGPAFNCTYLPSPGTTEPIMCTNNTLAVGASVDITLVLHIVPGTPPGTFMTNKAIVHTPAAQSPQDNPQDPNDPNTENNTATATTIIPSPHADLIVQKSGPSAARADTDVSYSITVINEGPDAASSVALTDKLPGTMTFVSVTQNSGPAFDCSGVPSVGSGGTVTCTISSLAAGTTSTFTLIGHIPPGTASDTEFTNIVDVNSIAEPAPTPDPNPNSNESATSLTVSNTDLAITKTGPATATGGGTIAWTITVTNAGGDTESNPSFSDALPAGTTFNSLVQNTGTVATCNTPGANNTGTVTCSLQPLAANASAQFTLTANISPTFVGTLNNTATVTGQNADPNTNNNSQTAATTVSGSADLTINKSGPATATAGTDITYTVTLTNSGPSTATSVSLTDSVPANTTFISESQTTGPAFSCVKPPVGGTGTITCTIGSFPVGSATFSITVHISPGATGTITNTANVASVTSDPNPSGNNPTVTTTITTSADLSVVKTATTAVVAGNNATYHIVLTNSGPSDAMSVTLTDTLPANTTFVSETQTTGPAFTCINPAVGGTGAVSCSIATLTNGTTATFDIIAKFAAAAPAGPSNNTAVVASATSDPTPGNNSSTAATTVSAALADLSITKTAAPGPYGTGQPLTYTIVVTNLGPSTASAVTVTDTLPAGTTLQSSTPAGACSGTTIVTCNAGTLANGASATFTLTITLPSTPGAITNTSVVSASAATVDPVPGNNTATSTITVVPAANIPMTSPLSLLLLCIALAIAGAFVQRH
jgi:large repetitive protein